MPRSRSSSIESSICGRCLRASTAPVTSRMRSARVDFPWSMWAMIEKLRMLDAGEDKAAPSMEASVTTVFDMDLPEPDRRLAPASRALWRVQGAGRSLGAAVIAGIATGALSGWDDRPGWLIPLLWALVLVAAAVRIGIEPGLR